MNELTPITVNYGDHEPTTEAAVEQALILTLGENIELLEEHGLQVESVRDLENYLTSDKGLEITCHDGSVWTLSITCYRRPNR